MKRFVRYDGVIDIDFIDESIETSYSAMRDITRRFSRSGAIPILQTIGNDYFRLYRVETPFIITDESHPMYSCLEYPAVKALHNPPELIAKLLSTKSVHFSPRTKIIKSSIIEQNPNDLSITIAGYLILISKNCASETGYLIAGPELCRKQLRLWDTPTEGIEDLLA